MIQYIMYSIDEIMKALNEGEKLRLIMICSIEDKDENFKMRKQFIKQVLVGRIGWKIEGWDFMQYCMRLTIAGNRLIKDYDGSRRLRIMG